MGIILEILISDAILKLFHNNLINENNARIIKSTHLIK